MGTRRIAPQQVAGLLIASYGIEAVIANDTERKRTKNMGQGWAIAGMELLTTGFEEATNLALVESVPGTEVEHNAGAWYAKQEQFRTLRNRAELYYRPLYEDLLEVWRSGDTAANEEKTALARLDVSTDELEQKVLKKQDSTRRVIEEENRHNVNWKRIRPNQAAVCVAIVRRVPFIVSKERGVKGVVSTHCPTLIRYAALAILRAGTGYKPHRRTEEYLRTELITETARDLDAL